MVSRVAKNPVKVPTGVEVTLLDKEITIKGKNGTLRHQIPKFVAVEHQSNQLQVVTTKDVQEAIALAGTTRALLNNMVHGVSQGFEKKLTLVGVGYRAKAQGNSLNLTVGFSHPVDLEMPEGVSVETPTNTEVVLKGADKQQVMQIAANIRAIRPPEPYKGKGIRYADEQISLKEGKKK